MTNHSKKRTIVFVTNHFLPQIGGVELSVHHKALAMAEAGHSVTIITETPAGNEEPEMPYSVIRFRVPVVRPFTRLLYWKEMWKLRAVFRAADVIHFHDYIALFDWFLPLAFLIRKPVYTMTFYGFESFPVKLRYQFFRTICTWFADVVVGTGSFLGKHYAHRFDAFYPGAPIRRIQPESPPEDRLLLVYVGRMEADTGILEFTKHLASFVQKIEKPVELRLIGSGSLTKEMQRLECPGLHIVPVGQLAAPDNEMARASAIIATGLLSVFDAFAAGKPVIFPVQNELKWDYIHSIPRVEEKLWLVSSASQTLDALQKIASGQRVVQDRVDSAYAYAEESSWENIAAMYIRMYEDALMKKSGQEQL